MPKTIINFKIINIILICLILALSILDAPEYIHCVHVGLCEFLEIQGNLSICLKSDITEHHSRLARNNFFIFLEDLAYTYSNELAKGLILFDLPFILTSLKFSSILPKKKNLYLQKINSASFLTEDNIISISIKILEISVIRSWNPLSPERLITFNPKNKIFYIKR